VVDGATGRLIRSGDSTGLADALGALLRDREGRQRLGSAGRARVREQFSAERTAQRVDDILSRVLAGRRSNGRR
ncbi:MAG: glycosyltransferase, partial [Longimicrobiales bacterium]